jgi:non-specific serine/threonine protein kinase
MRCGKRSFHFEKYQFRFLILDESQYIKNKTRKFLRINQIKRLIKFVEWYAYRKLIDDLWSNAIYQSEYFGSYAFLRSITKFPLKKQDETVCWN